MPDLLNLILSKSRDNCTFYSPERIFEFWSVKCFKKNQNGLNFLKIPFYVRSTHLLKV